MQTGQTENQRKKVNIKLRNIIINITDHQTKKGNKHGKDKLLLPTCHGIINKLVVMATNNRCLQSALEDLGKFGIEINKLDT